MGRKKLSDAEKAQAFTKVEDSVPVTKIAANLKVSRQAVYKMMKAARGLPKGTVPKRKIGSGRKRKTSGRTDRLLKQEVLASLSIMAANFKKHPELLEEVSIRTIQNHLKNDLGPPLEACSQKNIFDWQNDEKETEFR